MIAFEVAAFCSLGLLAAIGGTSLERADAGLDGGRVGWSLSYVLGLLLEPLGLDARGWQALIWSGLFIVFMALALGFVGWLLAWSARTLAAAGAPETAMPELGAVLSLSPVQSAESSSVLDMGGKKKRVPLLPSSAKSSACRKKRRTGRERAAAARDDRLPPLDLLVTEQVQRPDERNINLTAGLIEKTLAEFGIPAKVVGFRVGPTVTQFAVEPGFVEKTGGNGESDAAKQKVRVAQISALNRDLALALSAERLRIEAPVPGRPYVGIEVPNARSTVVRLRPILETEAFYKIGIAAGDRPGAGCLRAAGGGRPGAHAAPADRRHHRLG